MGLIEIKSAFSIHQPNKVSKRAASRNNAVVISMTAANCVSVISCSIVCDVLRRIVNQVGITWRKSSAKMFRDETPSE